MLAVLVVASGLVIAGRSDEPECAANPISFEQLNAAIAEPVVPFDENVLARDRGAVTDEQREAAESLMRDMVACSNAGEPLRVWSLYSDAYLARMFQIQGPFDEGMYAAYAVPEPADGDGMRIESIEDVWVRSDGVIGVEVVMTYPSVPMAKRLIVWMDGDPLRIEEITGEISFSLP